MGLNVGPLIEEYLKMSERNTIAVLFHGPACSDGFGSAWAAWTVLKDNADYLPVNYGDPLPDLTNYTDLYIVDFSYPAATLLELARSGPDGGRRVVVLDHHLSAMKDLEHLTLPNDGIIKFDMRFSGAVLTWDYFHPNITVPMILAYVQDRDLWKWELDQSKEVSAALDLEERTPDMKGFLAWSEFNQALLDDDGFNIIVNSGSAVVKYIQQKVEIACKKARTGSIAGYIVPIVNSAIWQSEIGERLCQLYERNNFAAVFYIDKDGKHKYSLRSRKVPGKELFDVSAVAKKYPGGGGHLSAAGFTMTE